MVMRVLGPLVVVSTLGLLGTGVLLVLLGEEVARHSSVTLLGFRVDWVTIHQAFFAVWAGATGLHLLGRIVPALRMTGVAGHGARQAVPGRWARSLWFVAMVAAAAALAVVLVRADGAGRPAASASTAASNRTTTVPHPRGPALASLRRHLEPTRCDGSRDDEGPLGRWGLTGHLGAGPSRRCGAIPSTPATQRWARRRVSRPIFGYVELRGFEPLTFSLRTRRATNCATAP